MIVLAILIPTVVIISITVSVTIRVKRKYRPLGPKNRPKLHLQFIRFCGAWE